jgi:hypothetical protein
MSTKQKAANLEEVLPHCSWVSKLAKRNLYNFVALVT